MKTQSPPKASVAIETVRLVWLAIFVSVFSFLFYQRHGDVLLYGDAVAHINIARRVFDSKTPGLLQLGTVWLPLPHLLMIPFIVSKQMWQSGTGASIPSMAAYVLGVLGIFRLARHGTAGMGAGASASIAWAAAILYGANPNLIYMQATAMGESVYLALFVWAVVYFAEFASPAVGAGASRSLMKCGSCLGAACLTRYDGWFLAAAMVCAAGVVCWRRRSSDLPRRRKLLAKFVLLASAGPLLWLAYNAAVYRNPLEFANGPYSAKVIAQKNATVNPAKDNLLAAASYFLKAAQLNVSEVIWQGRLWLMLALLGSIAGCFTGARWWVLLLWAPLPFYALSVAYGSIPIFVPQWWPFSNYNVRYGLQLLPAFSILIPLSLSLLAQSTARIPQLGASWARRTGLATLLGAIVIAVPAYAGIWRADPICYREAAINARGRLALDRQVATWIKSFPQESTLLMYLGEHVGALQEVGFPLRQVINEGNHRVWKQPVDSEGLWERALADPAAYADFVVGFEGDPAWAAARAKQLTALVAIHTSGQPPAIIFQGRTKRSTPAPQ